MSPSAGAGVVNPLQSSKPKIEIITTREQILVQPENQIDFMRIEVDVCTRCSSLVFDPVAHDRFHQTWNRA